MRELIKNLGCKLRSLRAQRGFTQENISEILNMSVSSYARMERGENKDIGLMKIEQVTQIFNIKPSELIKDVESFSNIQNGSYSAIGTNNNIHVSTSEEDLKMLKSVVFSLLEKVQNLEVIINSKK